MFFYNFENYLLKAISIRSFRLIILVDKMLTFAVEGGRGGG